MTLKSTAMAATTATAAASGASTGAILGGAGSAAAPGPIGLIVSSVIFSAQTGLDYRKYKKGEITKDEFKTRTKKGAFRTTGSLVGTTTGMVGGFFAGQLLIPVPVVGGIIGTVVGGFAGGLTGAKVSIKLYDKMEAKLAENRRLALEQAKVAKETSPEEEKKEEPVTV